MAEKESRLGLGCASGLLAVVVFFSLPILGVWDGNRGDPPIFSLANFLNGLKDFVVIGVIWLALFAVGAFIKAIVGTR